jgi:hypothetical protein
VLDGVAAVADGDGEGSLQHREVKEGGERWPNMERHRVAAVLTGEEEEAAAAWNLLRNRRARQSSTVSVDLTSSGWRGGVSRAGEWERKVGGGEKGATTVLIRFHAGAERRREKSGGPGFVHVQVEEKEGGGVTREQRSQAGGGANAPHEHMAADRGGGGGCQVEPLNSPRGAVQPGLNLIQISNEFKLF